MVDVAYLFPGQGAQHVGMGKDFYQACPPAKEIFNTADKVLGFSLSKICFEGPAEDLIKTKYAQPAILTVSLALLRSLEDKFKDKFRPVATAGLSLGEVTALVAAGSISFEDAVYLVKKRGEFMDEAAAENSGGMVSVIGLEREILDKIAKESGTEVANLNCPGQIVISGRKENISRAVELANKAGAKKSIVLEVSGPFHCSLMKSAGVKLKTILDKIKIEPPKIPIVTNVTANFENTVEEIRRNLICQMNMPTLWEDSIRLMAEKGIKTYLEIGPGRVIKGLVRRIDSSLEVINIEKISDLAVFKILS